MKNLCVLASILTLSNAADIFQTGKGTSPVTIPTVLSAEKLTLEVKTLSGTISYSQKTYDTADLSYSKDIASIPDSAVFAHQSTTTKPSISIPEKATRAIIDPLPDILWGTLQKKYPNMQFSRYKSVASLEQQTHNIVLLLSLSPQEFSDFIHQTYFDLKFSKLTGIHFTFVNVTEHKTPNTEPLSRRDALKPAQERSRSSSYSMTTGNNDDDLMFPLELDEF